MSKFGALHKGSKDQISDGERRRMISAHAAGVTVRDLATRFHRNHHTIEAVIGEHLLRESLAKYVGQTNTPDLRERITADLLKRERV